MQLNEPGVHVPRCLVYLSRRNLRDAHPTLRASALLALTKLMCLDAAFCDHNLQLIFTLLQNRRACPTCRDLPLSTHLDNLFLPAARVRLLHCFVMYNA